MERHATTTSKWENKYSKCCCCYMSKGWGFATKRLHQHPASRSRVLGLPEFLTLFVPAAQLSLSQNIQWIFKDVLSSKVTLAMSIICEIVRKGQHLLPQPANISRSLGLRLKLCQTHSPRSICDSRELLEDATVSKRSDSKFKLLHM